MLCSNWKQNRFVAPYGERKRINQRGLPREAESLLRGIDAAAAKARTRSRHASPLGIYFGVNTMARDALLAVVALQRISPRSLMPTAPVMA